MSIIGSEYTLKGLINLKKFPKLSFKYLALGSIYSIISLMHSEQSIAGAASYPMAVFFNKKHAHCGLSFLDNSIKVMNKKKKNLWDDLLQNLYHHKLIDKNTINSLIDKLKYLRKDFEIDKIIFNREEKAFLTNQILQMKVLNLSPIKFTRSDIKNFLDN